MLRISESVDGASGGDPEQRAGRDELVRRRREGRKDRGDAERGGPDQQQLAPADPVAERAHGDQRSGDEKAVDVDDPEQLRRGRLQVGGEMRHREVQHRQVHRVEQAR